MELMVTSENPLFVTVMLCPVLGVANGWLPKARVVGENERLEEAPVPPRPIVCGLLLASSVIRSDAVRNPGADGVRYTLTVQVP